MKKFRIFPFIIIFALILACVSPSAFALEPPELDANAVVLADYNTGDVLYSRNMYESVNPASLTKIMTVMMAIEAIEAGTCSMEEMITAGDDCLTGMDEMSSTANITPGETMSMGDLLYCSMLGSANEACNILATHIAGSISAFTEKMNMRAAALGCTDTGFVDPNGLSSADHTTAYDFFLITQAAASHEMFMNICDTSTYIVPVTNKSEARTLNNSNALISPGSIYAMDGRYLYKYASGIKTGYTSAAGYCLISTAEKDGVRLIAIVMGCKGPNNTGGTVNEYRNFSDSITLYDWGFDNFSYQTVLSADKDVYELEVKFASDTTKVALRPEKDIELLVPADFDPSSVTLDITPVSDELIAPIDVGTVLGNAVIKINGEARSSVRLVNTTAVELSRAQYIAERFAKGFSSPLAKGLIIIVFFILAIYILLVVRYRRMRRKFIREKRLADQRRRAQYQEYRPHVQHDVPEEPTQTFVRHIPQDKSEYNTDEDSDI